MANGYIPAAVERGCDPCSQVKVENKAFLGGVLGIDVNGERQPISDAGIVDLTFIEEETREAAEQAIASAQAAAESEQTASEAAASARSSESAAQTAANAAEAAKDDAEDAASSANASKNTADSYATAAQTAAAAAQVADGNAERSAESAIAAAAQAASSAGAAQQYANEAYTSASTAQTASGAAQDAQTAAEASASTASSAATTATQAATDAQTAQGTATQAAQTATQAKDAAQAAQAAAEAITPQTVTSWLNEHVDPATGYVIDNSLTIQGAAADAKKTGDEIADLNSAVCGDEVTPSFELIGNSYVKNSNGAFASSSNWSRTGYVSTDNMTILTVTATAQSAYNAFYTKDKGFISSFTVPNGTARITIPQKAAYFALSNKTSNMNSESFTLSKIRASNDLGVRNAVVTMALSQGPYNYASEDLWEIGAIGIYDYSWVYIEGYTARIRLKEGNSLFLNKGDVVRLTDYTNARFYIGYRFNDSYYYSPNWKTSDFVAPVSAEYQITVARLNDDTPIQSVSDLLSLLVIEKRGGVKNVKDYGALGDGVTDDATAIQKALNTSGTIFFPAGTYAIKNQLIFYSNTHIIMDSGATILRTAEKTGVFFSHCTDSTLEYTGVHNVVFEGGTIDLGTGISQGGLGIGVIHGSNITIRDVTFKRFNKGYHACDICCSKDITIENCIFTDLLTDSEYGECIQIDAADQFASFPSPELSVGANTFDGTPTVNVNISGCKFYLNSYSPAIGNHNDIASKRILFHDNVIIGAGGTRGAVAFDHYAQYYPDPNATTEIMIHHCIFDGCTYGFNFDVSGTGKAYIRDNIFKDVGTLKINPSSSVGEFLNNIELTST